MISQKLSCWFGRSSCLAPSVLDIRHKGLQREQSASGAAVRGPTTERKSSGKIERTDQLTQHLEVVKEVLRKVEPEGTTDSRKAMDEAKQQLLEFTGSRTWVELAKSFMVPLDKARELVEKVGKASTSPGGKATLQGISEFCRAANNLPYAGFACWLITIVLDQLLKESSNWASSIKFLKSYIGQVEQLRVLENQRIPNKTSLEMCKKDVQAGADLCCHILHDQGHMERFFKAQIQAGMLEKARENAAQTWTVMAATATTELLRRMDPISRPPSYQTSDAFEALKREAYVILDSMESSAAGKPWGLLLCGMGGIGKTTLAKVIYNCLPVINPDTRRAWITLEGPHAAGEKSREYTALLIKKQQSIHQQLLCDTDSPSMNPENLEDGRWKLARRLKDQNIALIIDDVWDGELLKILPDNLLSVLAPGSCIIITSRSEDNVLSECAVRDLEFLPDSQALYVFCYHAGIDILNVTVGLGPESVRFPEEARAWAKLILTVVWKCSGLPLSLEVMGKYLGLTLMSQEARAGKLLTLQQISQLTGQEALISQWYGALEKLQTAQEMERQKKIFAVLKLSYDALERSRDKEAFLDFACNPMGDHGEHLMDVWKAQKLERSFDVLISKRLIRKSGSKLTMHDQLRDLGRLIEIESNHESRKPRRIWDYERQYREPMQMNELVLCSKFGHTHMGLEWTAPYLGCLWWQTLLEEHLPGRMGRMVFLTISGADELKKVNLQAMPFLRSLTLSACAKLLSLGSAWPASLDSLKLTDCPLLAMLYEGPEPLHGLRTLSVFCCRSIQQLDCISLFVGLQELYLIECHSLEQLPTGIGGLSSLQSLDLTGCTSVTELPSSIGNLTSLQKLCLAGCTNLEELPEEIRASTGLTLNLEGCTSLPGEKLSSSIVDEKQGLKSKPRSSSHKLLRLTTWKVEVFRRTSSQGELPSSARSQKWRVYLRRAAAAQ